MDEPKRIVVIGASAGGLKAVTELVDNFPGKEEAAVFLVLHVAKHSMGEVIAKHIQKHTSFNCEIARDNEKIRAGNFYIAAPDHHMILKKDRIIVNNGPRENRWRPSIDVLFRSAAVAFNSKVIGIILSGLLDDGTSGMAAIKKSGGICIVQEPMEAEFADMPVNVLNNVDVDYRVPLSDMGYVLQDLFSKPILPEAEVPRDIRIEAGITERMSSSMEDLANIATHSVFTCPDCGGGLWRINDEKINRYRCHTGHVFTEKVMLQMQSESIEETLWVAIRMLEERRHLLLSIDPRLSGTPDAPEDGGRRSRAEQLQVHIERLKAVLQSISMSEPND